MTHAGPEAPRVATIHDVINKLGQVLPRPSAVFHTYALADTPWVTLTLSHCTPMKRGKVSSNSLTHDATQFGDSICPVCVNTFQMLVHSDPTDAGLNRQWRGLPPYSSEFMIQTTLNLPIQYSPFSNYANYSIILLNHIGPPSIERPLSRADSNHSSSIDSLHN
jgi:hypothetical protein